MAGWVINRPKRFYLCIPSYILVCIIVLQEKSGLNRINCPGEYCLHLKQNKTSHLHHSSLLFVYYYTCSTYPDSWRHTYHFMQDPKYLSISLSLPVACRRGQAKLLLLRPCIPWYWFIIITTNHSSRYIYPPCRCFFDISKINKNVKYI